MSDLQAALTHWQTLLTRRGFPARPYAPATAPEIAAAEAQLGFVLPPEVRELYLTCNGSAGGLILGQPLLTLTQMLEVYEGWRVLLATDRFIVQDNTNEGLYSSTPPQTVKLRHWLPGWLPLCNENDNSVTVDLEPGSAGVSGQIVTTGRNEDDHWQLAHTLADFFRLSARLIETGAVQLDEDGRWKTEDCFNPFCAVKEGIRRLES